MHIYRKRRKFKKLKLKFLQLEEIELGLFENHMASMEDPQFDEHVTKVAMITGLSSSIPCMCVCIFPSPRRNLIEP